MGSLGGGGGEVARNNAMWVYPKMMGANPSERWGHSACYFNGLIYIFGGCRGGVHFSDVLVCNLATMRWNVLKTWGQGPGPRDSHSAVLVGHKMLVFGGTNGCRKVNDLHILDLLSREWTRPECRGDPPCARESHTANVVGDEKMVIFGGSGEGEANYLNDLHVLDLNNMEWSSPEVVNKGSVPAPRDSHSAVAVGHRLFVFGGDSGYRYQGDVSVLDMNNVVWSKLDTHGPSPGARAGHAAVSIGTKVYVLGGVGDKQYYNDIWVLDVITSSWVQLETNSPKSQGRFSHTATVTNSGIAIFGGCGEDERPLNELLVLQIDSQTCRAFGNTYKEETKVLLTKAESSVQKTIFVGDNEDSTSQQIEELELVPKQSFRFGSGRLHPKRRRTSNSKLPEDSLELKEHSVSRSQQSSPSSQSDHEQTHMQKNAGTSYSSSPRVHMMFRQNTPNPNSFQLNNVPSNQASSRHAASTTFPEMYPSSEHPKQAKHDHKNAICSDACRVQCNAAETLSLGKTRNLMGAEVRGQVDGAFDSGYLMTATVNGKVFRGVLFAAGPDLVSRGAILSHHPHSSPHHVGASNVQNHAIPIVAYPRHPVKVLGHGPEQAQPRRSSPERRGSLPFGKESRAKSELQGVVLTLASPGSDRSRV
ncbi:tip elongation aberrant protein 1-like isoform X2 [Salvia miltiorrhiza]|uniref:tip elongation aberrant protein 1-like isoform X2 n=1 Tax=Salvia miltiorrhiza TaxID=226208 RepID=UPI0025AC2DD7|nr:tip elongation aberrant protein 1-like isoform X2 [Salvia miltiorrhiza]